MGIMKDGKYLGDVGDYAYCNINEFIKGMVVILSILSNGCYRVRLLNSLPGDFAHEFMITSEQIKPIITGHPYPPTE
jgi:hypothetical protein